MSPRTRLAVLALGVLGVGGATYTLAPVPCACTTPSYGALPTATVTAPAAAATVSGAAVAFTATASATAPKTVAGVTFYVDGVPQGAEDTVAPYAITWDTTSLSNGNHDLTAIARDSLGVLGSSPSVTVNVSNGAPGALNANVWVSPTGSDAGVSCAWSAVAGAAPGAAATLCATPQKACTLVPAATTAVVGIQAGTYPAGFNITCTPSATVTFQVASASFVDFQANSTLGGSGYVLQGTSVGNGVGFSLGATNVTGSSITLNNINLYCQASAPWQRVGDGTNTWCNTQFVMGGSNNTWNGGDQSDWAQCTPGSGHLCPGGQAANNQINSGSNLIIEHVLFHDFFIFSSADHSEFWKLNGGTNISFIDNKLYHCGPLASHGFGVAGCNSGMIFGGAIGSNPTANFVTFTQNVLDTGGVSAGGGINWGYNLPAETEYTMTFLYNSSDTTFSLCDRSSANRCNTSPVDPLPIVGTNVIIAGNAYLQPSFGGCFSGATYSANTWFTLTASTAAKCSAGTDHQLTNTTLATLFVGALDPTYDMTPTLAGPLIAAGENVRCPATDINGTARPGGGAGPPACDDGAIQR